MIYWLLQNHSQVPQDEAWLHPAERQRLAALRLPKRRADWRLGRWTAKCALQSALARAACAHTLGLSQPEAALWADAVPAARAGLLAQCEIRAAADGAPEGYWQGRPLPLALSLSHSADTAVCALAAAPLALGCDLEMMQPRSALFVADYFTRAEQDLVQATPEEQRPLLVNLIWSAKESTLKALRQGLREDTRRVEVQVAASPDAGEWQRLFTRLRDTSREFYGWWQPLPGFVLTLLADHNAPAPVKLF